MLEVYERDKVTCVKGTIIKDNYKSQPIYTFLVDGMLIDTGPKHLEDDLIPFFQDHTIDFVTLTHNHEDHTGTAPWLQKNHNLPMYIHPNGIETCKKHCPYPAYRQYAWGVRESFEPVPLGNSIQSRNHEWEVIYTPGHAHDHVALFNNETGRLFSGDLFVTTKPKVIMENESIPVTMESIRKLLAYDFKSMFCCHAGYIPNGKEKLKRKLDYLENISAKIQRFHEEGLSVDEITQTLFPKQYSITNISDGEWDSVHIVTSVLNGSA